MAAKSVSQADREDTFISLDIRLGAALESGMEVAAAAEACGVSERYVYKRQKDGRVKEVRQIFRQFIKSSPAEIRKVALENIQAELEQQLGLYVEAYRRAASSDDEKTALAAAESGLARLLGKPTSKVEVGGTIHQVALIEPETLKFLSTLVDSSAPLYASAKRIAGPVIDVAKS